MPREPPTVAIHVMLAPGSARFLETLGHLIGTGDNLSRTLDFLLLMTRLVYADPEMLALVYNLLRRAGKLNNHGEPVRKRYHVRISTPAYKFLRKIMEELDIKTYGNAIKMVTELMEYTMKCPNLCQIVEAISSAFEHTSLSHRLAEGEDGDTSAQSRQG